MRSIRLLPRVIGSLALSLGIALIWAETATAGGTGTVTIHKAECPAGVGSAIFEECHDNGLGGVAFSIGPDGEEVVFVTDENGVIGPVEFPSGHINIAEDPAVFAEYLGAYVYCRDLTTDTVLWDGDLGVEGLHGEFPDGTELVCDWYDITPGGPTGGVTTLPSTGVAAEQSGRQLLPIIAVLAGAIVAGGLVLRKRTA